MRKADNQGQMQFHILSFEGPDSYAQAGGIATRISGLAQALADAGFATHVWFVGDPELPGHESHDALYLHRWCQWISEHHPSGVYDGEDSKQNDYADSLPPFLFREVLLPHLQDGNRAVILAEEWHTVNAVLHLDWLLRLVNMRQHVTILWNANNTFSFDRIPWERLSEAATITTVSRYMKHLMQRLGVEPLVIPNGLEADCLLPPEQGAVIALRRKLQDRTILSKVARWDPDKQWLLAIETVAALKSQQWRPLLIARGGIESHGTEVMEAAARARLRVVERRASQSGVRGLIQALEGAHEVDVINLQSPIDPDSRRVLFRSSHAVLANSKHEPFGLVGLETMAAGGVACTGCSGEDYAVPGQNALVLETSDPSEFVALFGELKSNPVEEKAMRRAGRYTAKRYAWQRVIDKILMPRLQLLGNIS